MDQVELLTAIIEASIGLIGFSGLVIALGRRASGEWSPGDKLRLVNLLATGVIVLACTLVSLILLSAGVPQTTAWASSSVAWVILVLPFSVWAIPQVIRGYDRPTASWTYLGTMFAIVIATIGIQVANAACFAAFWLFALGLAVALLVGVTLFLRLLWFGLFR
jgi:hypothetical protein